MRIQRPALGITGPILVDQQTRKGSLEGAGRWCQYEHSEVTSRYRDEPLSQDQATHQTRRRIGGAPGSFLYEIANAICLALIGVTAILIFG